MKKIIIISTSVLLALTLIFVAYGAVAELLQAEPQSTFDRMISVMERTIEDDREFNDLLLNFEFIREAYGLSEVDMDFIAELIIESGNMEDVLLITYFWLDTNEGIGIIREIYYLREEFGISSFWIDFAFNQVTNNRHGVLSDEEVYEYLEKGLEFEDIEIASVLSRQGIMTIHDILDERVEGISFSELAVEIDSAPGLQRNRSRVRVNRESGGHYRNLRNQSDVLRSRRLSRITGENLEIFLEAAEVYYDSNESLEIIYETAIDQLSQGIISNLNQQGVLRRPRYGFEGEQEIVAHFRAQILNNGISERTLNRLFDEGFEYDQILNASSISNATNMDIREILERVQNGESWIQIIGSIEREGV